MLCSVTVKVGHGEDAAYSVGSKASVDRQFIAVLIKDFGMDFKNQCVDDKLLFSRVAFGIREMDVVDLPRQFRNLRAMIVQTVFQPRFIIGDQTARWEIRETGNRLCLGLLRGR